MEPGREVVMFLLAQSKESRTGHRHAPRTLLTSEPELGKSSESPRFTAVFNNENAGHFDYRKYISSFIYHNTKRWV